MRRALAILALFPSLAHAQWAQGVLVNDEGVAKGYAKSVNCVGAGVSCASDGFTWTITIAGGGGGGGSGLPADPSACAAGEFVTDQDASGVLSCSAVGWGVLSGKPATFAPSAHTHPGGDVTSAVANATSATTASALAANGPNCGSGQAALGVDASGASEGCWSVAQPAATTALKAGTVGGAFADYAGTSCAYAVKTLGADGAATCSSAPTVPLPSGSGSEIQIRGGAASFGTYAGSGACAASNWMTALDGSGAKTCTRPGFADVSGTASAGQLPAATGLAQGAIVLTGDLGGTAASPTVPGLSGKEPTITTLPQTKGGTGAGALTCTGTQKLTSNGTAYSCAADADTVYTLPTPTAGAMGGVMSKTCTGTDKLSAIGTDGIPVCTTDSTGAGGGAPTTATYITQTADAGLSAEQALSSLSTGIVKVTTGTGVLSTAATGTDYGPPTSGNATGLVLSTTGTGAHTAYAGASCAYAVKTLDASGAPTCTAAPTIPADTTATSVVTFGADAIFSNERVLTAGTNTTIDTATAGQIKVNATVPALPLSAANGGLGQAQPTCAAGQALTCGGTTCTCTAIVLNAEASALWTNSTTTATNVTGISWAIGVSAVQSFMCFLDVYTAGTTTGLQIGFTGPASPTAVMVMAEMFTGTTANTAPTWASLTAFGSFTAATTSPGATHQIWRVFGVIQNGTTGGTVQLQGKSNGTTAVNVGKGSTCWVH